MSAPLPLGRASHGHATLAQPRNHNITALPFRCAMLCTVCSSGVYRVRTAAANQFGSITGRQHTMGAGHGWVQAPEGTEQLPPADRPDPCQQPWQAERERAPHCGQGA